MVIEKIYINTYKFDYQFAKVCIASLRYWYPSIPVVLIKDIGKGNFDTSFSEKHWGVSVYETSKKKFGWGFGKLEPLFLESRERFLILDADTVMVGPVLDEVGNIKADFIVDEEVQPEKRLNEIYYDVASINTIEPNFSYPGYSFNTGQWFGTSGILNRADFGKVIDWAEPPKAKYPNILFNGEQGILNFILQLKQQEEKVLISRKKLMIWPQATNANFIKLEKIKSRELVYPFIIHWAGMKFNRINELPRHDIIRFYQDYYYSKSPRFVRNIDVCVDECLIYQKKANLVSGKLKSRLGIGVK